MINESIDNLLEDLRHYIIESERAFQLHDRIDASTKVKQIKDEIYQKLKFGCCSNFDEVWSVFLEYCNNVVMYGRYWTTGDREALKKEVITAKINSMISCLI